MEQQYIFALMKDVEVADNVISSLHQELDIPADNISYVVRDTVDDEATTTDGDTTSENNESFINEVGSAAKTGGGIGAAIGVVAGVGILAPIGAVVAGGFLATTLGVGGAVAGGVVGGASGVIAGGLVGGLRSLGVDEEQASTYEEHVQAGEVLIAVLTERVADTIVKLENHDAEEIVVVAVDD